jgi:predicted Zn finger-like uncharacterized protein
MQIICPNCETSYQVDASSMGPSGRSVRCARCRTVWFATNGAAMQEIAAAHRAEMAQFATAALGADDGLEWPQPGAAAADQMGGEPDPGLDPADAGFVDDAPPIASGDSAALDDPLAGFDMQSARNAPVVESPALAPIEHEPATGDLVVGEDIETVAARRAKAQAGNWRLGLPWAGWPTAMLALALLDVGLIGWRAEIVRLAPQTASLYGALGLQVNLRGLVIDNVTTETRTAEGVPVLLIQGRVVSAAKRTVEVPRLRFAVRNGTGNEIYTWTALPNRSLLSPGETLSFQSRLAAPPPETHDVLVRFFNRHDLGIGIE